MSTYTVPTRYYAAALRAVCCIALLAAFITGCRTYDAASVDPGPSMIHTTIAGRITDEAGNGLTGVAVSSGSQSATTDADGIFFIPNASVTSGHAAIVAKKPGFFNGARAAVPTAGGVTYMTLRMLTATSIGSIDAGTGGQVSTSDGSSISLPANAIVTSGGSTYAGSVSVFARHLDPTDTKYSSEFPGDLQGIGQDGETTVLRTFGVMLAELHGSNGEILQPAPGKPAQIAVAIPAALQSTATATVPLWYYDEAQGYWKEEGSASLVSNAFVGSVSHFTAWNCDYQGPWGEIHGRVVCGGVPIGGVTVSLGALVQGGLPVAVTDGAGEFRARVPASWDKLEYQILASENQGLYYTNSAVKIVVDPNTTKELGDISLDSPCPSYLAGNIIDCVGNPISGIVIAKWPGGGPSYSYTTDGHFKIMVGANSTITIGATADNGYVAQPRTVQSGAMSSDLSVPDLIACTENPDGFTDYSGSYDGSVLQYSDDGSKLVVRSKDFTQIVVLDAASMAEISRIPCGVVGGATVPRICFSHDGTKLLVDSGYYQQSVFDIFTTSGTRLTATPIEAHSATFSLDGNKVIATSGRTNFIYDIGTSQQIASTTAPGYYGQFAGLNVDGSAAYYVYGNRAYLWDIATNASVMDFQIPNSGTMDSVNMQSGIRSSYDRTVLGLSGVTLNFVDLGNQTAIATKGILPPYNRGFGIAPDDQNYVAQYRAGPGNTVGLFSMKDGAPVRLLDADAFLGQSTGVAIAPDGKHVAAVYKTGIRIWSLK